MMFPYTLAPEKDEFADRIEKLDGRSLVRKRLPGVGHAWNRERSPGSEEG